jgi:hypothetical protein
MRAEVPEVEAVVSPPPVAPQTAGSASVQVLGPSAGPKAGQRAADATLDQNRDMDVEGDLDRDRNQCRDRDSNPVLKE